MFKNLLKYFFGEGVAKIAPFITTLYIARQLSPEDFGKYSLLITYFEVIFIIVGMNIQATTRVDYFKLREQNFYKVKTAHLYISVISALMVCFFCFAFLKVDYFFILIMLFASLFRTVALFFMALFQCTNRANSYIACNVAHTLVLCGAVLLFILLGVGPESWLYAMLIASFFSMLMVLYLSDITYFLCINNISFNKQVFKFTLYSAVMFLPQAIGWWLKTGAERILISNFFGNEVLGNYSLAFQFSSILLIIITALNLVLVPEMNRCLLKKNNKRLKSLLISSCTFSLLLSLLLPFAADIVLTHFFSEVYRDSKYYIYLLSFPIFIQAILMIFINILYFYRQAAYVAKLIIISFVIQIAVAYIFILKIHVDGLVILSAVVNLVVLMFVLYRVRLHLKA